MARCTSTTGCAARSPTPTRRSAATLCERLGVRCTWCGPGRRPGNVQALGAGVRYAAAERLAGSATRDRRRPHRDRPGRDRALPARRLARPARAARDAGAVGPRGPAAAGADPGGDGGVLPRPRAAVARGRVQRGVRARTHPGVLPALRQLHPAAEANVLRARSSSCATRPRVLDDADRCRARRRARRARSAPARARAARRPAARGEPGAGSPRTSTRSSRSPRARDGDARPARRPARHRRSTAASGSRGPRGAEPMPQSCRCRGGSRSATARWCASGARSRSPTERSTRRRSPPTWRCAPGGRGTGCARSGSAARSRCRTCSPTARSRASARHRLPVVVSDGEIAWVPGVATGERFRVAGRERLTPAARGWPGA